MATKEKCLLLPVLPLRGLVMFPKMMLNFEITRKQSVLAIESAMNSNQTIFLVNQKNVENDVIIPENLYSIGMASRIHQILKETKTTSRVLAEGAQRGKILEFTNEKAFLQAKVLFSEEKKCENTLKNSVLIRKVKSYFKTYLGMCEKIPPDLYYGVENINDGGKLCDYVTTNIMLEFSKKQEILEEYNHQVRLQKLLVFMVNELDLLKLENKLTLKLKNSIEKNHREFFLREQIKLIHDELGDPEDSQEESDDYKKKILKLNLSKEITTKLMKEAENILKSPFGSSEAHISRNYLDICLSLPWNKYSKESIDIQKAEKILNKEHYALKDVKERIIELLAVRQLSKNVKGQIICLVGPPGIGKTSIAKSVAKALGRKYSKISLGGVKDESEIKGHRRTYVAAMPGRIINAMRLVKTKNPLILLDEVDKLSKSYHGDPAASLLEVLDAEQNREFYDHYVDLPFDLNEVMFIATANDAKEIPRPLYDRMEIINLYSYTHEEKFNIAKRHLMPKQLKKNGLNRKIFSISNDCIHEIIACYTKEAGVRELERKISSLMRKSAKIIIEENKNNIDINLKILTKMLGPIKYKKEKLVNSSEIGIVRGLAWTSVGGETMPIEVALMKGKGKVQITGSLGNVMKESAQIAISYIRSNSEKLGINNDFYGKTDIHIHAPEGAVPKDGPSAGITMTTAIVSALSKTPVKQDIAMTGEVTLKGKILPIGGLKEKAMAAYKAGVKTVIIPSENESDLQKIDDIVKKSLNFILADNVETVFNHALEKSTLISPRKILNNSLLIKEVDNKNTAKTFLI